MGEQCIMQFSEFSLPLLDIEPQLYKQHATGKSQIWEFFKNNNTILKVTCTADKHIHAEKKNPISCGVNNLEQTKRKSLNGIILRIAAHTGR